MEQLHQDLQSKGYHFVRNAISDEVLQELRNSVALETVRPTLRRRGCSLYAIRQAAQQVPAIASLAQARPIMDLVHACLGPGAKAIKALYFDKPAGADWKVAWHQDTTVAVQEPLQVAGFAGWTCKAGVHHARPPAAVLAEVLTLRLHLDDCDADNGVLQVLPSSHAHGLLSREQQVELLAASDSITCSAKAGDLLCMRPLLLHRSASTGHPGQPYHQPCHRRIVHLEYSAQALPGGLQWHGITSR